jgi:zinc transport system permease protein
MVNFFLMLDLFRYDFFVNAVVTIIFTSISCGIIGTYIVTRRIVFISGGITHASFGGIGLGYFLGINPMIGAVVFSILSAFGIEYFSKKANVREDSAIAVMWSLGMAIGIIFIFLSPGYAPNLIGFLFGSILTVSKAELFLIGSITAVTVVFFVVFYKVVLYIAFDSEFLRTKKLPVSFFSYILIGFVALIIVISIKTAGIILVLSLLTIPQITANMLVKDFRSIIFVSIFIGLIGSFAGLTGSYFLDIPSGASIIFTLVIIFILTRAYIALRKV